MDLGDQVRKEFEQKKSIPDNHCVLGNHDLYPLSSGDSIVNCGVPTHPYVHGTCLQDMGITRCLQLGCENMYLLPAQGSHPSAQPSATIVQKGDAVIIKGTLDLRGGSLQIRNDGQGISMNNQAKLPPALWPFYFGALLAIGAAAGAIYLAVQN